MLRELARYDGIKDSHSFLVLRRFKQDEHRGVAGLAPDMANASVISNESIDEDV